MSTGAAEMEVPLCVDLDGTLIDGDVFRRSVGEIVRTRPLHGCLLFGSMMKGRPHVKRQVAALSPVSPRSLRYNGKLLDLLRRERETGRRVLLVTGTLQAEAERVAAHVGLFDEVLGTSEGCNLTGQRKARALVDRFGQRGFDYVGNSWTDLAVWRWARQAWVVSSSRRLVEAVGGLTTVAHVDFTPAEHWEPLLHP